MNVVELRNFLVLVDIIIYLVLKELIKIINNKNNKMNTKDDHVTYLKGHFFYTNTSLKQ